MRSTTTARPRPSLRLNQRAVLVPPAQYAAWHELVSATAGLTELDRKVVGAIAGWHRQMQTVGYAGRLSIERMALDLGVVPRDVRAAVWRLIGLALIGVRPGAGQRASEYLLALPKRTVASLAVPALDDGAAPPF